MNIQTNDEKNTIPVTEDDAFSYDGYQVVRGEFFAHTYEPSFTFNSSKVSVNTACIKKLPDTDFVQILVNPDEKKLVCTTDVHQGQADDRIPSFVPFLFSALHVLTVG